MKANLSYNHLSNENDQTSMIKISGSKSESNRLLILQQFYKNLHIENISNCNDTLVIQQALISNDRIVDVHHAGTAMRFLTAYYSIQEGKEITLTGSDRMKERPIKILVNALRSLGADITYLEKDGFPPLLIKGKKLNATEVELDANVSSQYISALILIAPSLEKGLKILLNGTITSRPYLEMSLSLLKQIGIQCDMSGNQITIQPLKEIAQTKVTIESDWSSASYYYSLVALSKNLKVRLQNFQKNSKQGDSVLPEIYQYFGVQTTFNELSNEIVLSKISHEPFDKLYLDLSDAPDIAQTIAVTCFGLQTPCKLRGLHTLKIKETDRLLALKTELEKLGAEVLITEDSLELFTASKINSDVIINTYQDHRMAMAFAPLAQLTNLSVNQPEVVEKSYPSFWKDLENTGVLVDFK